MKIYFLASVTASKKLRSSFKTIIHILKEKDNIVNSKESLSTPGRIISKSVTDNKLRAKKLLESMLSSDCVVFEGTSPTTGGGYCLSVALQKNIPVLFLIQEEYRGLYLASYNRLLKIKKYLPNDKEHLRKIILNFLKFVNKKSLNKRFNLMITETMDSILNEISRNNGISKADVIRNLIYQEIEKNRHE